MLVVVSTYGLSLDLKLIKETQLSQTKSIIGGCYSFCVTEDDYTLLIDYKIPNIKIFNPEGSLAREFGNKGAGPNEFMGLMSSDYQNGNFIVVDYQKNQLFLFKRTGKSEFKKLKETLCFDFGLCIKLHNDFVFIPGYKVDPKGKSFDFFSLNLKTRGITYYLPTEMKYGLDSFREYNKKYWDSPELQAIGIGAFCDIYNDDAYYVWEGNLKVFKINVNSKKIESFGKKTANYIQPKATRVLINSDKTSNPKAYLNEKVKMSYVQSVFASKKFIFLIYNKPKKSFDDPKSDFLIQFYSNKGEFLKEIPINEKAIYVRFFFKKDTNDLYCLCIDSKVGKDVEFEDNYILKKYRISE